MNIFIKILILISGIIIGIYLRGFTQSVTDVEIPEPEEETICSECEGHRFFTEGRDDEMVIVPCHKCNSREEVENDDDSAD